MTEAQITALRDKLIAAQEGGRSPLAIKFDPMVRDFAAKSNATPRDPPEASQAELDSIEAKCLELAGIWHPIAIAALRVEITTDPEGVGYAGKMPEEVQRLLSTERVIYGQREYPAPNTLTERDLHLVALTRGVELDIVRAEYERMKPPMVTEEVAVESKPARSGTIWQRIPYCRNVPSLDNIAEALR